MKLYLCSLCVFIQSICLLPFTHRGHTSPFSLLLFALSDLPQDSSDEESEQEEDFSSVQFGSRYQCQRVLHASACCLATNNSLLCLILALQRAKRMTANSGVWSCDLIRLTNSVFLWTELCCQLKSCSMHKDFLRPVQLTAEMWTSRPLNFHTGRVYCIAVLVEDWLSSDRIMLADCVTELMRARSLLWSVVSP